MKPTHNSPPHLTGAVTVTQARDQILAMGTRLGPEQVPLGKALGRTLAHDLAAALTNPPFDASAMDGYAVRASDIRTVPATLHLAGESAAGWPYAGSVKAGEAVRIFTGAPVPDGSDTVVIQEDVSRSGDAVRLDVATRSGANIRLRGDDFHEGQIVLKAGTRLLPRHILLAASAGHAMLAVTRRPIVAILATGDELVEPSDRPAAGQIVSSNTYGLAAMIEAAGGEARPLGIAKDTREDLQQKIAEAAGADILVTMGGASVGDHDLVKPALEALGASIFFSKVAMRPGKPAFAGALGATCVLGLAGNPLSAMVGARVFLIPLIAKMLGRVDVLTPLIATLAGPMEANGPREHYLRATLDRSTAPPRATPFASQDSSFVAVLNAVDCLIVNPANAPAQPAGAQVTVLALDF